MVIRILNELFKSNSYLVCNDSDKNCIIIDPGLNEEDIDRKIIDLNLCPVAILATHGHFDHISGVAYFKDKYGIPFYLHKEDMKLMKSANFFLKLSKINRFVSITEPDVLFTEKITRINIINNIFDIFNYPGHTNGSCVIQYENNIFTGDTIFKKGLYVNKLPGENVELLKKTIIAIFDAFDSKNICYPGHGSEASLEYIKSSNLDLKEFLSI